MFEFSMEISIFDKIALRESIFDKIALREQNLPIFNIHQAPVPLNIELTNSIEFKICWKFLSP